MAKQDRLTRVEDKIDAMFKKIDCMCDPDPEVGMFAKLFDKTQKNTTAIKTQWGIISGIVIVLIGVIIARAIK
jgi:hypothetical protein